MLPKKTKINKEEKLITIKVSNLKAKEKYVVNLEIYKKFFNHELKLTKIDRVIKFNKKEWLKQYTE